ncbi:MAG: substrate-binding domain-containing protein [Candidatus Choladocola sp.]|nr:substrate-binding domain-containing protein [Candidatus Choladocola sp.]
MRKSTAVLWMAGVMACSQVVCGTAVAAEAQTEQNDQNRQETVELTVFAAASLTETLTEIGEMYEEEHPEVKLVFNFDSSGILKTQIQEGADCDLFLSAGQKQMDQLDISADPQVNTEGLDFVSEDTRIDLLKTG